MSGEANSRSEGAKMEPYAVIETGGKQYMVKQGDVLQVERVDAEQGQKIDIAPVLARSDGETLEIGATDVAKSKVTASVVEHMRGKKVVSFKKKRRKGYSRKMGHRQELTVIKVEAIS